MSYSCVCFVCFQEASKPENRAKHPWIITMGHRPMYCTNDDDDDCTHTYSIVSILMMVKGSRNEKRERENETVMKVKPEVYSHPLYLAMWVCVLHL